MMEIKKCKNKKCLRLLPDGYKHKYCENCRNEHVKQIKNTGKTALSIMVLVGGTALSIVTKGKINVKK
jgi:hypothetical protein